MEIPEKIQQELRVYLLHHESDIANQINDFGDLIDVFLYFFDRAPEG